ncbi:MAG: extracellular solute-binding protein [Patescibacteria group bacterium]|nr:extracellular solute-binding protein [Patescibacteria group bacterium]
MQFTKQQWIILGIAGFVILFFILVFIGILPGLRQSGKSETLTFWGTDDPSAWSYTISTFSKLHPGMSIKYKQVSPVDFQTTLINAMAAGTGPDLTVINNKWLYKLRGILIPAPTSTIPVSQVSNLFPQTVSNDFVYNNQVYAMPTSLDTLALIYNRDLFDQAGIALPPKTWPAFTSDAMKMRILSRGKIIRAGTAMGGTSQSISGATDITSLLMMQYGTPMIDSNGYVDFSGQGATQAVTLYTQFANPQSRYYTWNDSMGSDISAFENGKVGMIIGYASDLANIESAAPNLNIAVAPVPQVNQTDQVNFPDYWGVAVTRTAKDPQAAWSFANFAATDVVSAANYSSQTSLPPALRVLVAQDSNSQNLGAFVSQSLTAQDWTEPDSTAVSNAFDAMIQSITSNGSSVGNAISQAQSAVSALFQSGS